MARRGDGGDREDGVGADDVEERDEVGGAREEVGSGGRPEEGGDGEVGFSFVFDEAEGGEGRGLVRGGG